MTQEPLIRLAFFIGLLAIFILWEIFRPRRPRHWPRLGRWFANFGLLIADILLLRIVFPLAAVGIALYAQTHQLGLLNHLQLPTIAGILITFVLLDLVVYWQHRILHMVPLLWRIHKLHHTDLDLDISSAVRFHPVEILLSMLLKSVVIIAAGLPAAGVVIFEILLSGFAIFNHGNIYISPRIDHILRWFVATPDMHRIHHSAIRVETDSNFSNTLSCWDRIFGSYRNQPANGHQGMQLGLNEHPEPLSFIKLLWLPFRSSKNNAP
jgi:sterol desaturase/sphingolipid hydroxylase (fatty acid hydroxylase superfamily)